MRDEERQALTEALLRLADGDRSAFDTVYEQIWPQVRSACARGVGEADADDVAQIALIKVFERASSFDPALGDGLAWVLALTSWECRTARRAHSRRRDDPWVEEIACDSSPERVMLSADLGRALHRAMAELSREDNEVLWQSATGGERSPMLAATFRKRLQRALARLRQVWRARHG